MRHRLGSEALDPLHTDDDKLTTYLGSISRPVELGDEANGSEVKRQ